MQSEAAVYSAVYSPVSLGGDVVHVSMKSDNVSMHQAA